MTKLDSTQLGNCSISNDFMIVFLNERDSPYLGPPKESQICFSSAASPTRDALWKLGSFDNFQDENTSLELF